MKIMNGKTYRGTGHKIKFDNFVHLGELSQTFCLSRCQYASLDCPTTCQGNINKGSASRYG